MGAIADPTTRSMGMFRDPNQWKLSDGKSTIVRGVPVFDAHDEHDQRKTVTGPNGTEIANPNLNKLARRFDTDALQTIADHCNHRYQTTGDACPVTLGHTRPGEPEKNQPEICGYALNFRLGRFGPAQKLAILADFYIFPTYWADFLRHPRRSVELFPRDQVFDPIAVIKKTPERDLGLITDYVGSDGAATAPAIQHAAACRQVLRYHHHRSGERVLYSIPEQESTMDTEHKVEPPEQALPDKHEFTEEQYFRHRYHKDPVFKHMYDKAHAESTAAQQQGGNQPNPEGQQAEEPPSKDDAQRFSKEDAQAAAILAQRDTYFNSDPGGAYARAVEKIKADRRSA